MKVDRPVKAEAKAPKKGLGWLWVWGTFMVFFGCEVARLSS
jgi:hypothetical protein